MPAKRKADDDVSKELQEIRRSTRKLAKYILGLETTEPTEAQESEQTEIKFKLILTLNQV